MSKLCSTCATFKRSKKKNYAICQNPKSPRWHKILTEHLPRHGNLPACELYILEGPQRFCISCRTFRQSNRANHGICENPKSAKYQQQLRRDGRLPVCELFLPRIRPRARVRVRIPKKIRYIESLRNIHKGEEIWVLGCGPSLDGFPDGFFDEFDSSGKPNRIVIACKWTFFAWPNCTYTAFSRINNKITQHVLRHRKHLLHKHIVNLRQKGKGRKSIGTAPIYMRVRSHRVFRPYYEQLPKIIFSGRPYRYGATNTMLHWAIQAAIIMGAKKITCVGCEARTEKFKYHAQERGMNRPYGPKGFWSRMVPPPGGFPLAWQRGETRGMQLMRNGTNWLAKYFSPEIEITRYSYKDGYERIIK